MKTWTVRLALGIALLAAPAIANDMTITNGADLWPTAEGGSFTSFADDPIPADFFCPGSPTFTGKIVMSGKPLVTQPAGVLGKTDTIVRRLDDAKFDDEGVAITRIQLMALSLVGSEPVDVGCDSPFEVSASLGGEQPLTEMKIFLDGDWGGRYIAPLSLNVEMAFTPTVGGEPLHVQRQINLGAAPGAYWATTDRERKDGWGNPVQVDTDGDSVPDSALPGPSNFGVGMNMPAALNGGLGGGGWCKSTCTHCKPEDEIPPPEWDEGNDGCDDDHLHETQCSVPCCVLTRGGLAACQATEL